VLHVELAGSCANLGVLDPDAIDLARLGWQEDALI
jgi:hypothetical protein